MRVLLTGSSGFVGQHLLAYLRKKTNWEIITPKTIDILLYPLNEIGEFDYIINLGSASSVEQSIADPAYFISDNVNSTLAVLEYARQHPPKVFLHMSTVEVYNVTNPYAASKAAQEEIANAYWRTYNIPVVIARSSNIIGEGQSPVNFVPKLIEKIKAGETVQIYTSNGKIGKRVYNSVGNVCSAIEFLLKHGKPENADDFPVHFDIDGGVSWTNLTLASRVAIRLGAKLKYRLVEPEARPNYAFSLAPTGTKLTGIGWKPPQKPEQGLTWIR